MEALQTLQPFCRETGSGPAVVCLHANASSSGQWRGLIEHLSPNFRVFAPDSYDAGRSPRWPSDRVIRLRDEAALIEPVLARAGSSIALVGHSYGAALALIAAVANPGRVGAIVVYEPTLFALVDAATPRPNEADDIRDTVAEATAALDAGNPDQAAERFIDYWMEPGSWKRMPEARKPAIVESVGNVRRWAHALFSEPTPLEVFRTLDVPVLYMIGRRSTPSALAVARLLTRALPKVEVIEFDGLGHMGPITHPDQVNQAISEFLERAWRPGAVGRAATKTRDQFLATLGRAEESV